MSHVPYAISPADSIIDMRLDNECSDFMNGLVHGWINNLMALLEGDGSWVLAGRRSLRV
jgi:hypothetical protein